VKRLAIILATCALAHADTLPEGTRTSKTARYDKLPPYLSQPADPWAAVKGDQPLRWTAEQADEWIVRDTEHACTAAADHCLLANAWFFEKIADRERGFSRRPVYVAVFGPEGPITARNARGGYTATEGYTAYRTVPATKKNLAKGTLAVVLERPHAYPATGRDAVQLMWFIGAVDAVDFELGTVKLAGHKDSALLTSARVVVLQWEPGKKVEIVGGRKRDELAVKKQDVILPEP
jgi:hypothetical protein